MNRLVCIAIIIFPCLLFAQEAEITLKNGSVSKGKITAVYGSEIGIRTDAAPVTVYLAYNAIKQIRINEKTILDPITETALRSCLPQDNSNSGSSTSGQIVQAKPIGVSVQSDIEKTPVPASADGNAIACVSCKTENMPDSKFCRNCGVILGRSSVGKTEMARPSKPVGLNSKEFRLRQKYMAMAKSGNTIYNVGRVMAWGGLAISVFGYVSEVPAVATFGSLSLTVGIPVLGVGAHKTRMAAEFMGFQISGKGRGWPVYWTSWILQGAGVFWLLTAFDNGSENVGNFGIPVLMVLSGGIMQYVAWYQFSTVLDEANAVVESVSLSPTVNFADGSAFFGGKVVACF